jgi:hypothetical protein
MRNVFQNTSSENVQEFLENSFVRQIWSIVCKKSTFGDFFSKTKPKNEIWATYVMICTDFETQ